MRPVPYSIKRGLGGCYVATVGRAGIGRLYIQMEGMGEKMVEFKVEKAGDVTHVPICHGNP